jgi:hypothetical protein
MLVNTQLITIDFLLPLEVGEVPGAIERELLTWGVPLRWAITAIDHVSRVARVEAVVTIG